MLCTRRVLFMAMRRDLVSSLKGMMVLYGWPWNALMLGDYQLVPLLRLR